MDVFYWGSWEGREGDIFSFSQKEKVYNQKVKRERERIITWMSALISKHLDSSQSQSVDDLWTLRDDHVSDPGLQPERLMVEWPGEPVTAELLEEPVF